MSESVHQHPSSASKISANQASLRQQDDTLDTAQLSDDIHARGLRITPQNVLQLQRLIGNRAVSTILSRRTRQVEIHQTTNQAHPIQRVWLKAGNPIDGPDHTVFDPNHALSQSTCQSPAYVQVARAVGKAWRYTVYAYDHVLIGPWQVCVVSHAHIYGNPNVDTNWVNGSTFIPGWNGWSTPTPARLVNKLRTDYKAAIVQATTANANLPGGHGLVGAFPGDDRYPKQILPDF